ncbi:Cytochrome c, mono-and diheme variants [Marivirga sericea]|uniref:Cytochrome c, mono-and diheme variants n=1 Tax=Marivirga sericea TaxID=1028 RepID=A0A1X7KIK3_9BACT|nr:cytochrome c [Marivirga sericea]SMG40468.1 Cytochrome c, mono-and diheme variants [Marivirga sericea]
MKNKKFLYSIFLISIILFSCGSYEEFKNAATENYSDEKMQKYAKYMIQGKQLYTTHCSNCHQENGDGLGKLFPPLAKADYMLADVPRSICTIKNGLKGEIEVNGKTYNQAMPSLNRLTNLEIAEISTYIYNSWGNEKGMIELETVEESLFSCQ